VASDLLVTRNWDNLNLTTRFEARGIGVSISAVGFSITGTATNRVATLVDNNITNRSSFTQRYNNISVDGTSLSLVQISTGAFRFPGQSFYVEARGSV